MTGSSKSLIKALNSVFDGWSDSANGDSNLDTSELFRVIGNFHEKHNTLYIIKQSMSINDELFRIYNNYIKPSSNLAKEILFVEILKQLSPVLNESEIVLWLKTYLKPAVDSAGFDLQFVSKSREFIRQITIDIMAADDPPLNAMREAISVKVMDYILLIYIGKDSKNYQIINLEVTEEEQTTQVYHERIRFIKQNCGELLQEYGLKRTKEYFQLINKYFVQPSIRLDVLTLLSKFLSTQTSQTYQIINTDLFSNLLKSLSYDFSDSVILVSLSALVMLIPQICNKISPYLSDLFVVYIRTTIWYEYNKYIPNRIEIMSKFLQEKSIGWNIAGPDPIFNENESTYPTNSKLELDTSHCGTLLYGLFPLNFSKFCQAPLKYLKKRPSRLVEPKFLMEPNPIISIQSGSDENTLELTIIEKTKRLFRNFILHPTFINFDSVTMQDEIDNPLNWLLNENNGDAIGSEELSLACLSLNPGIIVNISDSLISPDSLKLVGNPRVSTIDTLSVYGSSNGFIYNSTGESNSNSQPNSQHVSRNSSVGSPIYINFKDESSNKLLLQKSLYNINRKLSVVPTNLIIDNKKANSSEIRFRDVKFDEGLNIDSSIEAKQESESSEVTDSTFRLHNDIRNYDYASSAPSSPELRHNSFKSSEPLTYLFSTHEKLFAPSSKLDGIYHDSSNHETIRKVASSVLNDKKNELHFQMPVSSPTTSLETTAVHKDSILSGSSALSVTDTFNPPSTNGSFKVHNGTAIEFYQRELLLMKNALEFCSYMKHLNKFRYIMLKLKMNKLLREGSLHFSSIENKNNILRIESLKVGHDSLNETINNLKLQLEESNRKSQEEQSSLIDRLSRVQDENNNIKLKLEEISNENKVLYKDLDQALKETIPEKDFELNQLRNRLNELEQTKDSLKEEQPSYSLKNGGSSLSKEELEDSLTEQEEKIYVLKGEILMLNEKNRELSQDLVKAQEQYESTVKNYELKLASSKLDLRENIKSFTLQYEKKIQELSATILRYEGLLEEKNSRILQLLTSKPVSIPGSPSVNNMARSSFNSRGGVTLATGPSSSDIKGIYERERGISNSSFDSNTTPPSNNPQKPPFNTYTHFQSPPNIVSSNIRKNSSTPSTQQPIIRGRGGYQKRSKKLM